MWLILALCALSGAVMVVLPDSERAVRNTLALVVSSLSLLAAWLLAARFILMDTSARRFWLVWMAVCLLLVSFAQQAGFVLGIVFAPLFLLFRSYKTWRHLSPKRRAQGFGLGLVALILLVLSFRLNDLAAASPVLTAIRNLGRWSLICLMGFWSLSIFHLAIRMRLHFMRLRPKLAVSAFLIGVIPLVLVVLLGLMIFYTGLGGARATRAANLLDGYQRLASRGVDLSGAPFDTAFTWPGAADAPVLESGPQTHTTFIPAPEWMPEVARIMTKDLVKPGLPNAPAFVDTTGWFVAGGDIWLMSWQGLGTEQARVKAWLLGDYPLTQLSRILKAGLDLSPTGSQRDGDQLVLGAPSERLKAGFPGRQVHYRDVSDDPDFWSWYRYFGGTLFKVGWVDDRELQSVNVFINLRAGWPDLREEFLEGEDNINVAVVVALGIMAGLFLILEVFAIFFGVRISEGFVGAVHALHRGMRDLGGGNLDARVDIPNEDEFGDLAHGFNDMTVALRRGRDDAVARERLTRELETAREIQERLLPSEEPTLNGFEVTGASVPSREIGGDYFDFLLDGTESIGVAIGDVSGKGMPAALLMSNLQASLHGQVIHQSTVAEVVSRVNDLIVASTDSHMFATFFYGTLDMSTGVFTSTNAGHNPPMLLRNSGEIEELTTGGLLLGMMSDQTYRQDEITLAPGEIIVLYTDGITEAVGPSAEEDDPEAMFGEEALAEVLQRNRHLPAIGIKEAILTAVAEHTEGVAQSDDITLVVIRRQG